MMDRGVTVFGFFGKNVGAEFGCRKVDNDSVIGLGAIGPKPTSVSDHLIQIVRCVMDSGGSGQANSRQRCRTTGNFFRATGGFGVNIRDFRFHAGRAIILK
jgi:hypothetical protein